MRTLSQEKPVYCPFKVTRSSDMFLVDCLLSPFCSLQRLICHGLPPTPKVHVSSFPSRVSLGNISQVGGATLVNGGRIMAEGFLGEQ